MRNIEFILIHESNPEGLPLKSLHRRDRNCGYHYVVSSEGIVLNPIDIHLIGGMELKAPDADQRIWFNGLNACSIGVQYNGSLASDYRTGVVSGQHKSLLDLLDDLSSHFPTAKILGVSELDRWHTRVSDEMNQLRRELSDYSYNEETDV